MITLHTSYQDYINSFPLSTERVGILMPGRYCGFDTMISRAAAGDIPITLQHSLTGVLPSDPTNTLGTVRGTILSPHGTIITEDADIPLVLSHNHLDSQRIDILYLEFIWADTNPGNTPTVSILQGIAGSGEPLLPTPGSQVIIGKFYLAGNTTTIAGVTYIPEKVPFLGGANLVENFPELDNRYAKLEVPNTFQTANYFSVDAVTVDSGTIELPETANTFRITGNGEQLAITSICRAGHVAFPLGTQIALLFENILDTSFLDGSIDFGDQVFRLSGPIMGNTGAFTSSLPLASGDVVELIFRGSMGGYDTWEVVNPVTYVLKWLYNHQVAIRALQNPINVPWVPVVDSGLGQYCFEPIFGASTSGRLNYRKNRVGQMEFKGGVNTGSSGTGYQKICTINPQYVTQSRSVIHFTDLSTSSVVVIPAIILASGEIYANFPHYGDWVCSSVVSAFN